MLAFVAHVFKRTQVGQGRYGGSVKGYEGVARRRDRVLLRIVRMALGNDLGTAQSVQPLVEEFFDVQECSLPYMGLSGAERECEPVNRVQIGVDLRLLVVSCAAVGRNPQCLLPRTDGTVAHVPPITHR